VRWQRCWSRTASTHRASIGDMKLIVDCMYRRG
jgi:hypothetical protein